MNFVIVKYASEDAWEYHFDRNPVDGVHHSYSCHNTYTGKQVGIQPSYDDKNKADADCIKINEANPSCHYAVCPVLTS